MCNILFVKCYALGRIKEIKLNNKKGQLTNNTPIFILEHSQTFSTAAKMSSGKPFNIILI